MREIESAREAIEGTVPVEPGGTFFVGLDRGSVEITSHEADEIRIVASAIGPMSHRAEFTISRAENDVFLDMSLGSRLAAALAPVKVKVQATIPRRYAIDVLTRGGRVVAHEIGGDCFVKTSGGRIEATRLNGHAHLKTSGGAILAEDVTGDVEAKTSGGKIRCAQVDGDLKLETSGGAIKVRDTLGHVEAKTSGGKIQVEFGDDPGGKLHTSGGSIVVAYPEGCGMELDAKTSGGRVKLPSDVRVKGRNGNHHVRASIDGGGDDLELRTSGGSIQLERWEPPADVAERPAAEPLRAV